jgi:Ca2+-binding RTX toxin-like protein
VPGPVRPPRPAVVEGLESRELLAANAFLTPKGQLRIAGTRKDDVIYVARKPGEAGKLEVFINSSAPRAMFDAAAVTEGILVVAGNGNDNVKFSGDNGPITFPVTILGGDGNDTLEGGSANDMISGGQGNDVIRGGLGNDRAQGDDGDDELHGNGDNDLILGGKGSDTINGGVGDDLIDGGDDHDECFGADGNDNIRGNRGDDELTGGNGNDRLEGSVGIDTLNGSVGDDVLVGGKEADKLTGGEGDDRFSGKDKRAEVVDFSTGDKHRGGSGRTLKINGKLRDKLNRAFG